MVPAVPSLVRRWLAEARIESQPEARKNSNETSEHTRERERKGGRERHGCRLQWERGCAGRNGTTTGRADATQCFTCTHDDRIETGDYLCYMRSSVFVYGLWLMCGVSVSFVLLSVGSVPRAQLSSHRLSVAPTKLKKNNHENTKERTKQR